MNLGRLVTQLSDEAAQKRSKEGSGRVSAKTEVLPEADWAGGAVAVVPTEPASRVKASVPSPMKRDEVPVVPRFVPPGPAPAKARE